MNIIPDSILISNHNELNIISNICYGFSTKGVKCKREIDKKYLYFCSYHNPTYNNFKIYSDNNPELTYNQILSNIKFCKKHRGTGFFNSKNKTCDKCCFDIKEKTNQKSLCVAICSDNNRCSYHVCEESNDYCTTHYKKYILQNNNVNLDLEIPSIIDYNQFSKWYKELSLIDKKSYIIIVNEAYPNKIICRNYIRGCPVFIDNENNISINSILNSWNDIKNLKICDNCKNNKQQYDHKNYIENKEEIIQYNIESNQNNLSERKCYKCNNIKDIIYFKKINDNDNLNELICNTCREENNISSKKRNSSLKRIEYMKELEKKDHMKEYRKQYRNINKDKLLKANKRWRKIKKEDLEYHRKNNERMHKYRLNNPEKFEKERERFKKDPKYKMDTYKRVANRRKINFELTYDQCLSMFTDICFYCEEKSTPNQLLGIDRINNSEDYTIDNCVSSCSTCNYLKWILNIDVFYRIVEHILTFNKMLPNEIGKLHPYLFKNSKSSLTNKIYDYKSRANKKGIEFELNQDQMTHLFNKRCYICNKHPIDIYLNGIDRFDNNKGYTVENCRSCCSTCNYLKGELEYNEFIKHLKKIYNVYLINNYEIEATDEELHNDQNLMHLYRKSVCNDILITI